jgi:hypothetical protein
MLLHLPGQRFGGLRLGTGDDLVKHLEQMDLGPC